MLIVAGTRGVLEEVGTLVGDAGFEIVSVTAEGAERVADAYRRWGKSFHPAGLNYGDCFAYALARDVGAALFFVGNDFSRTDIDPA